MLEPICPGIWGTEHNFASDAATRFPEATLLGTEGARGNEPDVDFDAGLEGGAPGYEELARAVSWAVPHPRAKQLTP